MWVSRDRLIDRQTDRHRYILHNTEIRLGISLMLIILWKGRDSAV